MSALVAIPDGFAIGYGRDRGGKPHTTILRTASAIEIQKVGLTLLVGLNGRGKTTFLKYLCGCLDLVAPQRVRTTYLPEELSFGEEMSSRAIIASTLRKRFVDQALDVAHRLELPIEKPYGQLSKGNKQKLRLVLSFIFSEQERSELLALDEPLSGLDFEIRETVWELMDAARPQRQIIASMHPDRLRARPSAVLAITKTGELHSLPDPIPETWEAIESFLHERA